MKQCSNKTFTSKFGLLETVKISDVPMLIVAIDFIPGRTRYCLSWISNGQFYESWFGEAELVEFLKMK